MEIYAGVPEDRLPVLVELAAFGGFAVVLRQFSYPGGAPNVCARAYGDEPADSGGRGPDPHSHLPSAHDACYNPDSIPYLHPLSHLHSLSYFHSLPYAGPDRPTEAGAHIDSSSGNGSNTVS